MGGVTIPYFPGAVSDFSFMDADSAMYGADPTWNISYSNPSSAAAVSAAGAPPCKRYGGRQPWLFCFLFGGTAGTVLTIDNASVQEYYPEPAASGLVETSLAGVNTAAADAARTAAAAASSTLGGSTKPSAVASLLGDFKSLGGLAGKAAPLLSAVPVVGPALGGLAGAASTLAGLL